MCKSEYVEYRGMSGIFCHPLPCSFEAKPGVSIFSTRLEASKPQHPPVSVLSTGV